MLQSAVEFFRCAGDLEQSEACTRRMVSLNESRPRSFPNRVAERPYTAMRWENGHHTPRPTTREKIRDTFEQEGIEFANGGDPGVRLFRSRQPRPVGHAPVN